ncbi:MAG: hypothetical protein AAF216_14145 [Pseudomonadota bacterium]
MRIQIISTLAFGMLIIACSPAPADTPAPEAEPVVVEEVRAIQMSEAVIEEPELSCPVVPQQRYCDPVPVDALGASSEEELDRWLNE